MLRNKAVTIGFLASMLLPLVALFYVSATIGSAVRYWSGKGGQWKARVQAPTQENS